MAKTRLRLTAGIFSRRNTETGVLERFRAGSIVEFEKGKEPTGRMWKKVGGSAAAAADEPEDTGTEDDAIHSMSAAAVEKIVEELTDADALTALEQAETRNQKNKGGRKKVFAAIEARRKALGIAQQ